MNNNMSLDSLNDLVYVNISKTSTTQKCPINNAETPCIICQEKCNLSFTNAYFQASCSVFNGGLVYSNMTTNSTSYLTFNENNFNVNALYLLVPSINTYLNRPCAELVIESMSDYGYLIIYIPVIISSLTTVIIPDILTEPQSLANINLYNYLPSQMPFYFYSASYKNSAANYIIFPTKSCNVTISNKDYLKLMNTENPNTKPVRNPTKNYFKLFAEPGPIYYNETGANTSSDNDYYLDCRVADYEEIDTQDKIDNQPSQSAETQQSTYTALSFILVAIVCLLLYLSVLYIPKFIN